MSDSANLIKYCEYNLITCFDLKMVNSLLEQQSVLLSTRALSVIATAKTNKIIGSNRRLANKRKIGFRGQESDK